jgi:hypothetical protein
MGFSPSCWEAPGSPAKGDLWDAIAGITMNEIAPQYGEDSGAAARCASTFYSTPDVDGADRGGGAQG